MWPARTENAYDHTGNGWDFETGGTSIPGTSMVKIGGIVFHFRTPLTSATTRLATHCYGTNRHAHCFKLYSQLSLQVLVSSSVTTQKSKLFGVYSIFFPVHGCIPSCSLYMGTAALVFYRHWPEMEKTVEPLLTQRTDGSHDFPMRSDHTTPKNLVSSSYSIKLTF